MRELSRRRLLAASGVAVALLLAVGGVGWSQWDGAPGKGTTGAVGPAGPAGADGADGADGGRPPDGSAAPTIAATGAASPGAGAPAGRQADPVPPRIQPFARGLTGATRTVGPSPAAPPKMAEGLDGCDHGYGEPGMCVPWRFPAGVTDGCGWLREHGYPPLTVRNDRDRHGLDTNGDGIACGPEG